MVFVLFSRIENKERPSRDFKNNFATAPPMRILKSLWWVSAWPKHSRSWVCSWTSQQSVEGHSISTHLVLKGMLMLTISTFHHDYQDYFNSSPRFIISHWVHPPLVTMPCLFRTPHCGRSLFSPRCFVTMPCTTLVTTSRTHSLSSGCVKNPWWCWPGVVVL